jgi:hypothetical protein
VAVWSTAVFVTPDQPTGTGGGYFTTFGGNGLLPVVPPFFAIYPWSTYGSSPVAGGGQGGGISVF